MIKMNKKTVSTFLLLITFFAFNANISAKGNCFISKTGNGAYKSGGQTFDTHSYKATCNGNVPYVALCLDPGKSFDRNGISENWNFQGLSNSSQMGRVATALYKQFKSEGNCNNGGNTTCVLKYQNAIRKMIFDSSFGLSSYDRGYVGDGTLKAAYTAYKNQSVQNISNEDSLISAVRSNLGSADDNAVTANFQKGSNGMEIVVSGTSIKPQSVSYSIGNGASYTDNNVQGSQGSNTYTVKVPNNVFNSIDNCVQVTADVVYNQKIGNGGDFGIAEPTGDGVQYIQGYLLLPLNGSETHVTATSPVGPSSNGATPIGGETYEVCEYVCNPEIEDCEEEHPEPCENVSRIACSEPSEFDPKASKEMSVNEGTDYAEGETEWERCIIHNTDTSNNPYDVDIGETTASGFYYLYNGQWKYVQDANFCSVSCKEKYDFDMPASKAKIRVGTYFSFDISEGSPYHSVVGIKAEKQCVTSGAGKTETAKYSGISSQEYERRIINLRQQQLDYLNAYYYYSALAEALDNNKDLIAGNDGYFLGETFERYENKGWHIDDAVSFNYYNWRNYETNWNNSYSSRWGSGKIGFNVYGITQKYLTNPNSIDSGIGSTTITGNTSQNFRSNGSTYKYLVSGNNLYRTMPGFDSYLAELFDYDANAYFGDEYKEQDYYYSCLVEPDLADAIHSEPYTSNDCGPDTASVAYQTKEHRVTGIEGLVSTFNWLAESAKYRVMALAGYIEEQRNGMSACTLDNSEIVTNYEFDPDIEWYYDQESYKSYTNKKLVLNDGQSIPSSPDITTNYCDVGFSGSAASVFNCSSSPSSTTVNYIDSSLNVSSYDYTRISRVGKTMKYECNGTFCYYRSESAFYTYPSDGIVTTDPYKENATIIDKDGYVYPVSIKSDEGDHPYSLTFSNIGQYFGSNSYGRLMGGSNAVLEGDYKNKAVCKYEVYSPTIENDDNCITIVNEQCKNEFGELYTDHSKINACVNAVLAVKDSQGKSACCTNVENILSSGVNPPEANEAFHIACKGPEACSGFKIISNNNDAEGINASDMAKVDSDYNTNGALKFSVRTVSLNNLFPNGNNAVNWHESYLDTTENRRVGTRGLEIGQVIDLIQSKGESIYGEEPDYSVTLTPECMRRLREDNRDFDNGFLTYNLSVNNQDEYNAEYLPESYAYWNDTFEKEMSEIGCPIKTNSAKNSQGIKNNYRS